MLGYTQRSQCCWQKGTVTATCLMLVALHRNIRLQGEHSPLGALTHISVSQLLTWKFCVGRKAEGCARALLVPMPIVALPAAAASVADCLSRVDLFTLSSGSW